MPSLVPVARDASATTVSVPSVNFSPARARSTFDCSGTRRTHQWSVRWLIGT
jgi:hypothetical protein